MQIRWAAPTRMQSALFLPFPPLNYLLIHLKAFPTFCHHKNAFESLVSDAAQSTCVTSPLLEKSYRWILLSSSYAPVLTPSNRQTCTGHIIQFFSYLHFAHCRRIVLFLSFLSSHLHRPQALGHI